jgi:hypothetical protein
MSARTIARWSVAIAAAAVLLFVMARASAAPVALRNAERARLRLSWSARPERIEVCRTLSPEELAQREEHMRQRVECDGRFATYTLRIVLDERPLYETVVHGAGLRHDRPLYLLREIDIAPGPHRMKLSFVRREKTDGDAAAYAQIGTSAADTGLFAGRAQREAVEHARRARAAIPPRLELDTTLVLAAGRVVVVTLDPERGSLLLVDGPR